jgi:putative oxidoreductase
MDICQPLARRRAHQSDKSAAQIPNSRANALTLTRVTSQPQDSQWQRHVSAAPTPRASASLVDPDDDLSPTGYAGIFETATIPRHDSGTGDSGSVGVSDPGYGVAGDQDPPKPLPYVQPRSGGRYAAFDPAIDTADDGDRVRAAGRRGTQNLGLLILRVGLGVVLVAHGVQKLFGWWGGQGLAAFKSSLSDIGYQHADILTYCADGGEIIAGLLLVLGLLTPLAAAGALAYQINGLLAGISGQANSGPFPFFLPDGHEYDITLIVMAVAVILVGPGRYGFDAGRGWARRPFIGSFAALLLGVGGGAAVWVLLNGANPLA